jgi:hypothetical protein
MTKPPPEPPKEAGQGRRLSEDLANLDRIVNREEDLRWFRLRAYRQPPELIEDQCDGDG